MTNYAILHAHSEFSVRDSLIRVDELAKLAKERGWSSVALTDHGGIEGLYHFKKAAKDVGIKPILGCEFYVKCSDDDKKTKAHHLTVMAKSAKGFSSITKALSIAHKYHYRPSKHRAEVPMETVLEMEDVIILSGCFSSPFWRPSDRAPEEIAQFVDRFKDDFYFEIQAHYDWQPQLDLNKTVIEMADAFGRPVVVTPDCHIASPADKRFHDALLAVQSGVHMGHERAWKFETHQTYVQTPQELREGLVKCGVPAHLVISSLEETGRIAEKVKNWVWEEIPPPKLPDVGGNLVEIAKRGLETHGLAGRPEYEERLQIELDAFMKAGLDKYLLLVRHCVNLFKNEGAEIGPRGSVGGSLVGFTLGLANLDPIAHGLSWQRFWAPGRVGMPDVDIDVDADFRTRVGEVLRKEFGEDNVAQISNFSKFGLRMAIRDAARAFGVRLPDYPPEPAEKDAKDVLDLQMGLDLQQRAGEEPVQFARMLFNRVRQFGTHAGGFVIADKPLTDGGLAAVVCRRDIGGGRSICWDMKIAEKLGFVKFDFLGVDSLSAIKEIGKQIEIDWMKVPLDDTKVIRDICEGRTAGVPQFLTPGLRTFTEMLQPTCFEELVWANAAFRPGGLGQMSPAELAATYREAPNEIMVYQEEIMESCVQLAGFTWTEADGVRKVVAKKEGRAEWAKLADKFADGCVRRGTLEREEALKFWQKLEEFTRYAFNKSHAAAYSWHGYRVAWAKRHYPKETFCALLNAKEVNAEALMDEAPLYGVKILPAHANTSEAERWAIETEGIRPPLTAIDAIDLRVAKSVLIRRRDGPFKDSSDFVRRMGKIKYLPAIIPLLFDGVMVDAGFTLPLDTKPAAKIPKDFIQEIRGCDKCALRASCRAPVPPEIGKTNVLIVGEAPGYEENKRGRPFVGRSGELIFGLLYENGVEREDVTITNATHCFPCSRDENGRVHGLKDGDPSKAEGELVCDWVHKEIERLKPPLILAVGRKAWQKLGQKTPITKSNGKVITLPNGSKVVASIHPAHVLRDPHVRPELERALRKFAKLYHVLVGKKT